MTLWPIFYKNGFCVLYFPNLESQALAKPYWAVNVQDTTKYLPSYKIVIGSKEPTVLFEMSTEGQEQVMSIKTFLLQIDDEKEKLYTYMPFNNRILGALWFLSPSMQTHTNYEKWGAEIYQMHVSDHLRSTDMWRYDCILKAAKLKFAWAAWILPHGNAEVERAIS